MKTSEIRKRWLDFFASRGHTVVPSASLISSDPSVLFTIAGMVPFIPYLTGIVPAPYPRATSVQKCIRTNDIEEVGKTPRHGTFFQMNGNFSFGDYFKKEAIEFAWTFLTAPESAGGLGFAAKDLWVTVYAEDDEAIQYWLEISELPAERIQKLGKDTNYWHTGQPGPAGPCSEIFFDRGPSYGQDGGPATDDDRYVEIWNLVFMQFLIDNVTSKTEFDIVSELPKKNIDTGMGLERVAFIKQGVDNMYEIDEVRPVLDAAAKLAKKNYGSNHEDDVRLRVVADHIRSALMLIADGVTPSNEARGYILRRLLRRAIRAMRLLGVEDATFPVLFQASRDAMQDSYPEVAADYQRIATIAYAEEEAFLKTLVSGTHILEQAVAKQLASKNSSLDGNSAFLLHDTYGFPIDLTIEMAEEAGLTVDRTAFDKLMAEQRQRAKADAKNKKKVLADLSVYRAFRQQGETEFTGYTELETEAYVLGIIRDGQSVPVAKAGETVEVILSATALYAEGGGQEADQGILVGDGVELEVLDVQRPVQGLISHLARVNFGELAVDETVTTLVDKNYRLGASQAHSATHLIHAALRQTLGQTAHQSGSLNKAGYMRLDYAWNKALSDATKSEIEEIANLAVQQNHEVVTRILPLDEAKSLGAMALFGEKYGELVRVVDINGAWSRELCAGIHVQSSAQIGPISMISESSVGSSARRIEALVGYNAFRELAAERAIVAQLSTEFKVPRDGVLDRIHELITGLKQAEKKISDYEAKALSQQVPSLLAEQKRLADFDVVSAKVSGVAHIDDLRELANQLRSKFRTAAVIALASVIDNKPAIVVTANQAAQDFGIKAGQLVKQASAILGGGGGGRNDIAQGGGTDASKIDDALLAVEAALS